MEFKNIFEYEKKIRESVYSILSNVFNEIETNDRYTYSSFLYDYTIETEKKRIYCKIMYEEGCFQYFWKKNVPIISKHISSLNKKIEGDAKEVIYIIVVTENKYIDKLSIPSYPNIYFSNLKLLKKDLRIIKEIW